MNGMKWESFSFKDLSYEKAFGSASSEPILPLGRSITDVPLVFQGLENTCVSCAVTWIRQYMDLSKTDLSHEWLAGISHTDKDGATPSQVLEPAKAKGIITQASFDRSLSIPWDALKAEASKFRIPGYLFLKDLSPQGIYSALKRGPLAIGVDDWMGEGPHMMVVYDVTDDGTALKAVSWSNSSVQELVVVMFQAVELAVFIGEVPASLSKNSLKLPMITVLKDKLSFLPWKKIAAGFATLIALIGGGTAATKFGASGAASGYRTTLSSGVTASQTTLPVSSVTLTTGEVLTTSTLRLGEGRPVYLKVNPGGATEELYECWGLSSLTFNGCIGAIGYLGTGATTTIATRLFPHAAGETVIMSNDAPFFNSFMDTYTNQSVTGTKTFTSGRVDIGDNTSATSKYIYFQTGQTNESYLKALSSGTSTSFYFSTDGISEFQLNASGTVIAASTTKAAFLTNGFFGVTASSTGGIGFDPTSGGVLVNVSSTASDNGGFLKYTFGTANQIYWDIVSFLGRSNVFSGTSSTFTGAVTLAGNVTSTGTIRVPTPVGSNDAVNKNYFDVGFNALSATGTAEGTIVAGKAVYVSSTGQLLQTDTSAVSSTYRYVGVALTAGTAGQTISYTRAGGINCAQSGMTISAEYFLNGASGAISITPATNFVKIGRALSATCLQLDSPYMRFVGSTTFSGTGSTFIQSGFYPTKVTLAVSNAFGSGTDWIGGAFSVSGAGIDENKQGTAGSAPPGFAANSGDQWNLRTNNGGATRSAGTVSTRSPSGLTLNEATHTSTDVTTINFIVENF